MDTNPSLNILVVVRRQGWASVQFTLFSSRRVVSFSAITNQVIAIKKRIVAKLDTLFGHPWSAPHAPRQNPVLLKQFRQAVLTQAVTGKLTEETANLILTPITIGRPSVLPPKGWRWVKLIEVASLESGHTPRKTVDAYWNNGTVPWISLQDIREAHGKVITKTKHYTTPDGIANSSARILPAGTVCFSRDISVGYVTIMGLPMATTQHFANWISSEHINNRYLMYCFMVAQNSLIASGQGTTVRTIYMPALREMQIMLPPREKQDSIVNQVSKLLALTTPLEINFELLQQRLKVVPDQILTRIFRPDC